VRFKESVGEPAMDYLTRWRMIVASDRLANAGMSIAVVAPTVGYESESAFGAAFKRVIGTSPRQFAKKTAGYGNEAQMSQQDGQDRRFLPPLP
jgi:AraC-like DNA-binding protein